MVKLMDSLSDEMAAELTPMFERGERSADEAFALGLGNLIETAARYAPLLVAVSEEWPAIPELKEIWFRLQGNFTTRLARMIESERAAGARAAGRRRRRRWPRRWCGLPSERSTSPWAATTRRWWTRGRWWSRSTQLFVGTIYGRAVVAGGRYRGGLMSCGGAGPRQTAWLSKVTRVAPERSASSYAAFAGSSIASRSRRRVPRSDAERRRCPPSIAAVDVRRYPGAAQRGVAVP